MKQTHSILTGLFLFGLGFSLLSCGRSVPRAISMDNVRLTPQQIRVFDQRYCGYLPDGNYFVDSRTGQWSIEISPDPSTLDMYSQVALEAGLKMVKFIPPLEDHCKVVEAQRQRNAYFNSLNQLNQPLTPIYQPPRPERRKSLSERGLLFPSALSY